tara:strand:+ start:2672 stop:3364 length:693 start_codon:yes stop_codon:yes gene_type:complete
MKFKIFFIHGWGFGSNFWLPIINILKKNNKIKKICCLDLGFFSQKNTNIDLDKNLRNIFVVHSYGLNWFLKRKIECYGLINFFAAPSFVNYQRNSKKRIMLLRKMLYRMDIEPDEVLKDFYINSGLKRSYFSDDSKTDFRNLKNSLENLLKDNLTIDFKKRKFMIFSFFSLFDRIFVPSPKKIAFLEQPNHCVKYLKNFDHSSPFTKPDEISNLINRTMERLTMERLIDF